MKEYKYTRISIEHIDDCNDSLNYYVHEGWQIICSSMNARELNVLLEREKRNDENLD